MATPLVMELSGVQHRPEAEAGVKGRLSLILIAPEENHLRLIAGEAGGKRTR